MDYLDDVNSELRPHDEASTIASHRLENATKHHHLGGSPQLRRLREVVDDDLMDQRQYPRNYGFALMRKVKNFWRTEFAEGRLSEDPDVALHVEGADHDHQ